MFQPYEKSSRLRDKGIESQQRALFSFSNIGYNIVSFWERLFNKLFASSTCSSKDRDSHLADIHCVAYTNHYGDISSSVLFWLLLGQFLIRRLKLLPQHPNRTFQIGAFLLQVFYVIFLFLIFLLKERREKIGYNWQW